MSHSEGTTTDKGTSSGAVEEEEQKQQQEDSSSKGPTTASSSAGAAAAAPSSDLASKYAQWDRLAKEMEQEEEEEEDGVNKLFKSIYRDSSDEVKKAMVKSFTESQGTVLSTNWNEVKKDHVDIKPPEGSEFKQFGK
ncbi:hypothetical protein niasHT_002414 [Heterodera trifolii]|uniref:SGS domain-containing protein n=1 Tax=Heterodera trifolii TaxID=157864 RepID=A0ABD2LM78_9BILA